jgi:hypothetical protein
MAKKLSKTGISTSSTIQAWHVSQSVDALASPNADAYNISISGSLRVTGSVSVTEGILNNLSSSFALTASHALNAGGTPGGSDTQIQFNDAGAFGGATGVTYSVDRNTLLVNNLEVTTNITASGAISSSFTGNNTFNGNIYLANNKNIGGENVSGTGARPLVSRNTSDETQLGSTHHPIRFGNYVSSSYDIKTTATIEALTGSFSYLTGSSPIVIDADNIKVDSVGNVSNIAAITASGAISGSGDLYGLDANNKLLALTEISISSGEPVTFDLPSSGTTFSAINLNSDATNRFAKITFVAPRSGNVRIEMQFNMIITTSTDKPLIGLHSSKTGTTQPDVGWFLIRSDEDAAPTDYRATFIKTGLTPGTSYSYYFMGLADFSSCTIRAGKQWTEAYDGTDPNEYPGPIRIYAYDLGDITITSNPTG